MAVTLQFFNVIIPIKKIITVKGKQWWIDYLKKNSSLIGSIFWFDKYLFRDGGMDMDDVETIIKFWETNGLKSKTKIGNKEFWNDLCVVDAIGGPTLFCDWLVFVPSNNKERSYVYLKGRPIGKIMGKI